MCASVCVDLLRIMNVSQSRNQSARSEHFTNVQASVIVQFIILMMPVRISSSEQCSEYNTGRRPSEEYEPRHRIVNPVPLGRNSASLLHRISFYLRNSLNSFMFELIGWVSVGFMNSAHNSLVICSVRFTV